MIEIKENKGMVKLMPQIKKKKSVGVMVMGSGVLGAAVIGAQNASADTVVTSDMSGAGQTVISDNNDTPNQSIVNLINSQLRNLQEQSGGIVQIASTPKILTSGDVNKVQASIVNLQSLLSKYNALKAQLQSQNNSNAGLTGMVGADNSTNVTGNTLDQTSTNLNDLVSQMEKMVASNQTKLDANANMHSQDNALTQKVIQNNKTIASASDSLNNIKNGIVGNLDDVNRKSQDSTNAGGIVVDNTETQKVNTVETHATVKDTMVTVGTVSQADKEMARILADIKATNKTNSESAKGSADYKDNSFANIDDINVWLKNMQTKAEKAKVDAAAATTSINKMDSYTSASMNKLNDAMRILVANKAPQSQIDNLQTAINNLKASGLDKVALPAVGQKDPINFGDIGQTQTTQNGAQDGTIANTKTTQDNNLTSAIATGVAQVIASNNAANAAITPGINKNTTAIDEYLDALRKGSAGVQVDTSFLNGMQIYNTNNNSAIRDFYQKFVRDSISQTEDTIQSVYDKIDNAGHLNTVPSDTTMAQLSASMFAANAGTMNDGFGSVMLPSTNINDLVVDTAIVSNSTMWADSRNVAPVGGHQGGAAAVYDALVHLPGYGGLLGGGSGDYGGYINTGNISSNYGYAGLAALKDMKQQYLDANGSANTLTYVTDSPSLTVKIKDAFVYTKEDGTVGRAPITVNVSATSYYGTDIFTEMNNNGATASGTRPLFVYNFQINPYTGQLVTGVGYIAMQGYTAGTGTGIPSVSGGGEGSRMAVNSQTSRMLTSNGFGGSSEAANLATGLKMQLGPDGFGTGGSGGTGNINLGIGMPMGQNIAQGIGLAQSIKVKVDPTNAQALKYAQHAPLFVSDIDDSQELIAYTGGNTGKGPKIVTAEGQTNNHTISNWNNIYGQAGTAFGVIAHNTDNVTGTLNKVTTIDGQSAAVFNVSGDNTQIGLRDMRVTLRSRGDASNGYSYQAVDTALFAPFGIVGAPSINIDTIKSTVNTLEVNIPKAKAETKGKYNLASQLEYITASTWGVPQVTNNMSGEFVLPSYLPITNPDKIASSNTSIVVTQKNPTSTKTSSGSSLTVIANNNKNKTASGNSLVVISKANDNKTSSGSSLVVQEQHTSMKTSSGNSFVIRSQQAIGVLTDTDGGMVLNNIADAAKSGDEIATRLMNVVPLVDTNSDGTTSVTISAYVDPEMLAIAKEAMNDWALALSKQGVKLEVNYTSSVKDLRNGVTVAILNTNNTSEQIGSRQLSGYNDETLDGLGGLATVVGNSVLNPNGRNDVYNASGTVTAGDTLGNTLTVIQLNTQALATQSVKNQIMSGNLNLNVLKHEIGHVFGLSHSIEDSLMTPYVSDVVFTGSVSNTDAYDAAENLKTRLPKTNIMTTV